MATINSFLKNIAERVNESNERKSKYYYFLNNSIVVRVADHISAKYIDNKNVIQIITPQNNNKNYLLFYLVKAMIYDFREVKSFINNFISMREIEHCEKEERVRKTDIIASEIFKNQISIEKCRAVLSTLSGKQFNQMINKIYPQIRKEYPIIFPDENCNLSKFNKQQLNIIISNKIVNQFIMNNKNKL